MAGKVFGIEIGNDTIKLAVCIGKEVKELHVRRLPEGLMQDGIISNGPAVSEMLQTMCKENGLRPGKAALVLPPEVMISHKVRMPVMSAEELSLNLPYEFRDFVGKDGAKYYYDYVVQSVENGVMNLYAAAVKMDVIGTYDEILRKAGFSLRVAIPAEMAWMNLVNAVEGEPAKLCVVDIGHRSTLVSIYSDGKYETGRDINIGSCALDMAISASQQIDPFVARNQKDANMDNILSSSVCADVYSELAVEVMRVVNYYQVSSEGLPLQDIYYCGGGSLAEGLRVAIMKRTEMTMHHIRRLLNCSEALPDDLVAQCALAAGAGIQAQ